MPRKNKIIIRTGSAAPTASDFVAGEPAWDSTNGKLYIRNAAGTMVEIAGGGGTTELVYTAATTADLPATGDASKLYVVTDTNKFFRWVDSTTKYVELGPVGGGDTSLWNLFLPPAPTNVSGTAGNAQISLTWTAPTVSVQTPITDYLLQYSTSPYTSWTTFSDGTSTSSSATVNSLANGTTYKFRVAAVNAIGTGSYSTASAEVTAGSDEFFSSVEVLLHMEGSGSTFTDSSGTPKTITAAGSVTQSTTEKKYGSKSAYFSTTSDSLSFADVSLGTGNFCVECFFRISSSSQYAQIFGNESSGSGSGFSLLINNDSSTGGQVAMYRAGGLVLSSSGTDWSDGAWHHVALARSGSTIRLYLDGTSVASATDSNSYSGSTWYLGLNGQYAGRSISSAYLDEFRLTKGQARYTGSTLTVPTSAFPDA